MATINAIGSNKPIEVSLGGTGVASVATAYAPICGGTTTTAAFQVADTGLSTTGNVLTSNGASALPSWQTPANLYLLQTQSASNSADITFTSTYITSSYKVYFVVVRRLIPATDANGFYVDMSTDNGSTYLSANYRSGVNTFTYNSATAANNNSTSTCPLSRTNQVSSTYGVAGAFLWFYDIAVASGSPSYNGLVTLDDENSTVMGYNTGSVNINNLRFKFNSGNITSGDISLYGLKL